MRDPLDRLTALDLMGVWPEARGWSNDIGALAILDGTDLLREGRFPIAEVRDHVARRLHLLPRFRQVLYRPAFGLGWPLWVDVPGMDLTAHVQHLPLDGPVDESLLLLVCEKLRRGRLPFSRPLWAMTFITGLPDGKVALFIKVHHAVADGAAGITALGALFDVAPDPPGVVPPAWTPVPLPARRVLLLDNLRRGIAKAVRIARRARHPAAIRADLRQQAAVIQEIFGSGRPPSTSLTAHPIGSHRRFSLFRADLATLRGIAGAAGATVNDVLLTALAAGLRTLLLHRGESVEGVILRAAVPVSLHAQRVGAPRGNLDGMMSAPLPLGQSDDLQRLRSIAAVTRGLKQKARPQGGALFRNPTIQWLSVKAMATQNIVSTYATNVVGPPCPLYFNGSRVLELFPVVPITGNVSLGVGALSYNGQFNVTAVVDRDLVRDLDVFTTGMRRCLARMTAGALVPSSERVG